jgi:hypothetical protein
LAAIVAVLLLAAAGLLVLGVLLERHTESGSAHPIVATTEGVTGVPRTDPDPAAQRAEGADVAWWAWSRQGIAVEV